MDITKELRISMKWNNAGDFTAELINGNISQLHFCQQDKATCLESVDLKYLHAIHDALGDLFNMIDDQQKTLGYSFPLSIQEGAFDGVKDKSD